MTIFAAYLAPIALLVPALTFGTQDVVDLEEAGLAPHPSAAGIRASDEFPAAVSGFQEAHRPESAGQVSIERRVVIRISPRRAAPRADMLAALPQGEVSEHLEERKMGRCIPIDLVAGVQPADDSRLILYLRDRRMVSARLERACSARDFYSGFYVERTGDGQICAERDQLQSRAGSTCGVEQLHQLVAVRD